ncbi:nuclear hormone receptor HR96 isoform X2 [Lingula anatina]|uniref:Nuclear hormone receptor HR96 isoform X2 n=1 Tax=Lingula anatina TaxID=7574 RepID=A0A1S3I3P5_LINAN|nr:nuclear hormone receptor HR96 isoform X2 [Lingula anatina]|eukprot:XP_013392885.1 nuclear hormone receptor HR96 isoform X2 [Lingula anatina]
MLALGSLWHHLWRMEEEAAASMPMRGRAKVKEDKYCGVCGDRALGYNFDAISCESCKAFFRRNAPKGLEYFKCPYDEKCKMDVSNRRFCKRCRLKKCFEIGMRKEYILTEEERVRKRQKIEENRYVRVRELEKQGITIKTENGVVSSSMSPSRRLTDEEHHMIEEIRKAYRSSLEITVEPMRPRSKEETNVNDLVNIAEISVRRVIDMAKKIKTFKVLPQTTQISLLKGGAIELLILRSVLTFDKEKQQFLDPTDDPDTNSMSVDELKQGEGALFEEHMRFVKGLVELRADETMLILMLCVALFSPDRPALDNKGIVSEEQEKYSLLLQKYLESKFPLHYAKAVFPKLLMKLVDIRNLNEEHSQVLLKVNPEGIQPLMKEVLDLNNT